MTRQTNTIVRLCIVAAIVAATYGGAKLVGKGIEPAEVVLPDWTFEKMPLQLGDWHGQPAELEPEIVAATGASPGTIVNRTYQDGAGHSIAMHTAMFTNPRDGVYHTPMNCYRAGGWQDLNETFEKLKISDSLTIPVSVSTWTRERTREKVMVVYWYQLGEHVLFSRLDFGMKVFWGLRGRAKWPPLIKVMLQIPAPDLDEAKPIIMDFATQVAAWENQPSHRRQMLGEMERSASPRPSNKK